MHLASRDVLTIAGLRQLLKPCAFISITGTSSDDDATIAAVTSSSPDILVLSSTNEQEVKLLADSARLASRTLKVVVLADETLARQLVIVSPIRLEAILVRGGDYLEDIGAVLRIVHRGGRVTSGHHASAGSASRRAPDPELSSRLNALSVRETIILRELAQGCTNAQIAQPLHLSVATIKADLAHIMDVMQASSRVDLAVQAVQCGLIDDEPEAARTRMTKRITQAEDKDRSKD